ncbi:hypothetical protein RFI_37599, partial [Reticulomyxa filosa]
MKEKGTDVQTEKEKIKHLQRDVDALTQERATKPWSMDRKIGEGMQIFSNGRWGGTVCSSEKEKDVSLEDEKDGRKIEAAMQKEIIVRTKKTSIRWKTIH